LTDVGSTPRKPMSPMRRLRIWEAHKGRCVLCRRKIDGVRERWIIEHVRALALGGTDTDDNCGPAHASCGRDKTKADNASWSKAKRQKAKHVGASRPKGFRKLPPGWKYSWKTGRPEKETA
jgi:5-methylcytosine-specific restriction protein A